MTDDEVQRFVSGTLPVGGRDEAELHLDACASCRRLVSALATTKPRVAPIASERDAAHAESSDVGRYRLDVKIGSGAMGDVFQAYDPELHRSIAVKLLRAEGSADAGPRARLLREARALARLADPHVVAVYDVGIANDRVFIAMELVAGGTLTAWLMEKQRAPGEIVAAFVEAARGLQAAHAVGLVHRDFKPDNVLRRDNGHFVVTDFGVARWTGDIAERATPPASNAAGRAERPEPPTEALALRLTREGAIVGTPLYMAPEQLRGEIPDARSDQYSFCAALLEALDGVMPFQATSLAELLELKEREPIGARPTQTATRTSARVRAAVLRGLHPQRAQRHRSMAALIVAISPRRRRLDLLVASCAALIIALAAFVVVVVVPLANPPCQGAERHLVGAWDELSRQRVRASLVGASEAGAVEDGAKAFLRVDALLSSFATKWSAAHTDACVATEVHREQSSQTRDARLACLHKQRKLLVAIVDELGHADAALVPHAARIAGALPSPVLCSDVERVRGEATQPADVAGRQRAESIEGALAVAYAGWLAGRTKEADAAVAPALQSAIALGHAPLIADAHYIAGIIRQRLGDHSGALTHMDASMLAAEGGHADWLAARATAWSLVPLLDLRRNAEARRVEPHAKAALARIGGDDEIEARLAQTLALLAMNEGNPATVMAEAQRSLAIWRRVRGEDHFETANALATVAVAASGLGDYRRAQELFRQALTMQERWYGADHPNTTITTGNLADITAKRGDVATALALHRLVLATRLKQHPAMSERVAMAWQQVGESALEGDDTDLADAEAALENARSIYQHVFGARHERSGDALHALGRVDLRRGRSRLAIERFRLARDIFGESHNELKIAHADTAIAGAMVKIDGDEQWLSAAEALFTSAVAVKRAKLPPEHCSLADNEIGLARIELMLGHPRPAAARLARALELREKAGLSARQVDEARDLLASARALLETQ